MSGTHLNCYSLLEKIRIQLNDYTTDLVQGIETNGKYKNEQIVDGINAARRYVYSILLKRVPYIFEQESVLTGVNSVYTLPTDFGILRYFKDSDGNQIYPISQDNRRKTNESGSDQHYYRRGNTLVIDKSGVTEQCTLIYYRKCRDIIQGKASAGGALSITLSSEAKKVADYYNNMVIENITQDWFDTITDYSAARVATIVQTAAANDYYGIVCDMPEEFHHLYIPRAVYEITGNYVVASNRNTVAGTQALGWQVFNEDFITTLKAYIGEEDTYPEDVWTQYGRSSCNNFLSLIPGHE